MAPGISANSNETHKGYNFHAFANIGNIKFPENLQP